MSAGLLFFNARFYDLYGGAPYGSEQKIYGPSQHGRVILNYVRLFGSFRLFALRTWFLERNNFTYASHRNDLNVIGHYTQMVWAGEAIV